MPRNLAPAAGNPARGRLRGCIAARQAEEARLAALTEAQDRAHREGWAAQSRLQDAESELRRVIGAEPQRRVYAFVNADAAADLDPVADAKAAVEAARFEVTRIEQLEDGLAAEISWAQSELRQRRSAQYAALAEIVEAAPEYAALVAEHGAAWARLRTVRKALDTVAAGCHGQGPQRFYDEARRSEPLEADRIGYPIDPDFVAAWADALAALDDDADAPLPNGG